MASSSIAKVELAVHEVFDSGMLGEGVLYLLEGLRRSGVDMVPASAKVYAELLELRFEDLHGVNLTLLNPYRFQPQYHSSACEDAKVLSAPFLVDEVDFRTTTQEAAMLPLPPIPVTKPGVVSAVRMWFVLDFGDGATTLDSRDTHWKYAVQYVVEARFEPGDVVPLSVSRQGAEYLFRVTEESVKDRAMPTPRADRAWMAAYQQLETNNNDIIGRLVGRLGT